MTAYTKTDLENLFIQRQAEEALKEGCITADTFRNIKAKHATELYIPNLFVKLGMGFLTSFIIGASCGLFILFLNINSSFDFVLIFFGTVCYGVLEMLVAQKKHYNSGVDNILMIATVNFIVCGIGFGTIINDLSLGPMVLSFTTCLLCVWLAVRFTDSLAAIVAVVSFLLFVFYLFLRISPAGLAAFPFVLIVVSAIIYFLSGKTLKSVSTLYYKEVWTAIELVALLALYFSGNYYVVQNVIQDSHPFGTATTVPMAWFFWIWTMVIPLLYLYKGIRKKEVVVIRTAVVLISCSVFTFRFYHAILSPEGAMILAGALLILLSYSLMKYLKFPTHGYVFKDVEEKTDRNNLEALIIGEAFGHKSATPEKGTEFGGGSFGGAGAGDKY